MKTRIVALAVLLSCAGALAADERDDQFESMMSGVRMEGKFSVDSMGGQPPPEGQFDDLYMVSELERGEGSTWIFKAGMSYGDNMNMEIPVPVRVEWAGDTPVLTMDEQAIEGMGTFTVRLLFFEGRYAGTWQHGPAGGHMWGKLVSAAEAPED